MNFSLNGHLFSRKITGFYNTGRGTLMVGCSNLGSADFEYIEITEEDFDSDTCPFDVRLLERFPKE